MNRLVHTLASIVRGKVLDAAKGRAGGKLESRFIFHGPPLDLLEDVFEELAGQGGVKSSPREGIQASLPVLLQLPPGHVAGPNPGIGVSGKCDENHLLHIRNDPNSPSFVALMPPGQHNNRSVASTTEEFGMNASSNTGHATFDEWWEDGFVQQLVTQGLKEAGLGEDALDDAMLLVEHAAAAMDDIDYDEGSRMAAWRLLSRIYSIPGKSLGLSPGSALALACGIPPMQDGSTASKPSLRILEQVADEMADGFRTGVDRMAASPSASDAAKEALPAFLDHVQAGCEIPTAFERATQAFYLPWDSLELEPPPSWWSTLTTPLCQTSCRL